MSDFGAMVQKEFRELTGQLIGNRLRLLVHLGIIAYFAVLLPLIFEESWIPRNAVVFWVLLPSALALPLASDSFAGEHERHTLETLLALPLESRAILAGKLTMQVLWAWLFTQLVVGLSLITANMLDPQTGFQWFTQQTLLSGAGLSLVVTIFLNSLGMFVSARTSSTRQAQMLLGLLVVGLGAAAAFGFSLLPQDTGLRLALSQRPGWQLALAVGGLLLLISQGLLLLTLARLRRPWQMLQ